MSKSGRPANLEMYLSPNSVLCAWMDPESDIRISLTRVERIDCRGQLVQRKKNKSLSEEKLFTFRRFFPLIDQFICFQRIKFIQNFSQQTRSLSSQANLSNQTSARSSNGSQQQ